MKFSCYFFCLLLVLAVTSAFSEAAIEKKQALKLSLDNYQNDMKVPNLKASYVRFNAMQRNDTTAVLKKFACNLNWTEDDYVLDIGCGPGDVTVDFILPLLSDNSKLVGTDISEYMIEYAKETYTDKRLKFLVVDFGSKYVVDVLPENTFSKIFSFYVLHWIKDQKMVAKNLASLLRPSGEVLALIMAETTVFPIYKELYKMEKWRPYMQDVDKYISPYYDVPNITEMVYNIFPAAGLTVQACELRDSSFVFPSFEIMLRSFDAVNPFLLRIPEEQKAEFRQVIRELVIKYERIPDTIPNTFKPKHNYKILVLKLYKP